MKIALHNEWEDYVAEQVASGKFASADEVVEHALRGHKRYHEKLDAFRREVDKGVASIEAGRVGRPTIDELFDSVRRRKHGT